MPTRMKLRRQFAPFVPRRAHHLQWVQRRYEFVWLHVKICAGKAMQGKTVTRKDKNGRLRHDYEVDAIWYESTGYCLDRFVRGDR